MVLQIRELDAAFALNDRVSRRSRGICPSGRKVLTAPRFHDGPWNVFFPCFAKSEAQLHLRIVINTKRGVAVCPNLTRLWAIRLGL